MLSGIDFTGTGIDFVANLTADLTTIIPIALGVLASLWGLRVAVSYLKGIAR
jgi:hypothetical protein